MKGVFDIKIQCKKCKNFFLDLISLVNHCVLQDTTSPCLFFKNDSNKCYFKTKTNDMKFLIHLIFQFQNEVFTYCCSNKKIVDLCYINRKFDISILHYSYLTIDFEVNISFLNI